METMKLTDAERLILANQYEILSILKSDEFLKEISDNLRDGYEWIYSQNLHISPILSKQNVEHVIRILGIYGDMKASYEKLSDKSGIDESSLTFPGFDGNNEAELLAFAEALRKNHSFEITLGKESLNSQTRHHSLPVIILPQQ